MGGGGEERAERGWEGEGEGREGMGGGGEGREGMGGGASNASMQGPLTAMYAAQPAVRVKACESTSRPLIPKSHSFTRPLRSSRMLDGFTSGRVWEGMSYSMHHYHLLLFNIISRGLEQVFATHWLKCSLWTKLKQMSALIVGVPLWMTECWFFRYSKAFNTCGGVGPGVSPAVEG